jgi:hypothetical protein
MWNLGNLVHDLEKMRKLPGRCIGADLDRIADASGLPGGRVEATGRSNPDSVKVDAQPVMATCAPVAGVAWPA